MAARPSFPPTNTTVAVLISVSCQSPISRAQRVRGTADWELALATRHRTAPRGARCAGRQEQFQHDHRTHHGFPRRSPAPTSRSPSRPASSPSRARAPSSSPSGAPRPSSPPTAPSKAREGMDFFPLTIDVEERMYAAGRIPGSFFRREGRPTDLAILTCRLTDRPLRPSFPDGLPQRDPGRVHDPRRRRPQPLRRHHHQRRLRRADALRPALRRPDRRRAHGLRHRRRVGRPPRARRDRGIHLRPRGRRPRERRRRDRHHDGRGQRHRAGVGALPERRPVRHRGSHRPGPRGVQEVDQGLHRRPA